LVDIFRVDVERRKSRDNVVVLVHTDVVYTVAIFMCETEGRAGIADQPLKTNVAFSFGDSIHISTLEIS
jgi:hypothetical protein